MSDLTNEIKSQQRVAAENVILLDLRKKGLLEDNQIIRPVNGSKMAKAKNDWFASKVGQSCLKPEILYNPEAGQKYLKERLEAAFIAGAQASIAILGARK